ncbi:MtrAB system histidine kinase MtrB [Salinibacterium sp. SYSU T00001]|uniref:MtrAB system histidine kinase MtrB n=1 Tax=Homoserinimonas sedimenticola TaxID=2986805 RepID=UPI002235A4AF|nr:MtrAB system histidine kinase MtrB [Salinibacterium sedimenticola]MCW4384988.1 MtrAB system histidine kinase MtrB [Salinibacterium sedimenticola]
MPAADSPASLIAVRWRMLRASAVHTWRSSLQFRTVAITVVLSGLAVMVIGTYMSAVIGGNLFTARRDQVEAEHARATLLAQDYFSNALAADDATRVDFDTLSVGVQDRILSSTTSPGSTGSALLRVPGQSTQFVMPSTQSRGFDVSLLSRELREVVREDTGRVYLQSVTLPSGEPGLVAGSLVSVPSAGNYEFYLVFDLADAQETLDSVQQTLIIGLASLVLLIGAVTWIVVRLVVAPVRLAAAASERLAAGQLEERIPERGEDVIATLARSFNGMADSLQQKITRLAEVSRMQQRFVSDVSHELRTPLTTIRLAGDVLYDQRDAFPPTTARTAELLHTQVERFELLLADLLEISRYDAGAVELELEPTNLVRLVEDAVESMEPLATERGSELTVVAPGGHFDAEVDPRRIRRILRNLLGNAIEHGEGKPIEVTVDSTSSVIALTVRDHGIGMTPEQLERVFDRFWRADPSRTRTIGGTGLGLAISQEDAALHGGTLDAWSELGEGTCFRLVLPREHGGEVGESPLGLPPAAAGDNGVEDAHD